MEKQRSKANTIFILNNQNTNKSIKQSDEILSELANHFANIYKTSDELLSKESLHNEQFLDKQNWVSISQNEFPQLRGDISENDVLSALKTSKNGSSPGLDGLPCEVYKFFWDDLKKPLLECYNYSYNIGSLADSQRQGMICLLHKGKGSKRDEITSWRPITLTNFDYKL